MRWFQLLVGCASCLLAIVDVRWFRWLRIMGGACHAAAECPRRHTHASNVFECACCRRAAARRPCRACTFGLGGPQFSYCCYRILLTGVKQATLPTRHVSAHPCPSRRTPGPWAGTPTALLDVLSARLEGLEAVLDSTAVRQLLQGLPSLTWSFPAVPPVEDAGAGHTHGGTGAEFAALGSRQGEAAGEVAMGAAATGWPAPRAVLVNRATGKEYGPGELGQALRDAGANEVRTPLLLQLCRGWVQVG